MVMSGGHSQSAAGSPAIYYFTESRGTTLVRHAANPPGRGRPPKAESNAHNRGAHPSAPQAPGTVAPGQALDLTET